MMGEEKVIIPEIRRPLWQIIAAALCFTGCAYAFLGIFYPPENETIFRIHEAVSERWLVLLVGGIGLCYKKGIQIRPVSKEFKATFEIGPLVLGQWKKIPNPEYVSVFQQLLKNGQYIFEVNLWYDTNKHWQLYTNEDYRDAFLIGFDLSEELDIDLLDATTPNDYKWVDKDEWREKLNETS
ncbi:hypothetical protein [uncultured Dokdonia sp.]|uniref:hypothetical protein n=1 Tax=uncultured Dokdonia sp. TaxID=575653 RepID=UPI00262F0475|nr:hypothetical protein [uncultured Dokdonia sp.]